MTLCIRLICIGILGAGVGLVYMGLKVEPTASLSQAPFHYKQEKILGEQIQKSGVLKFQETELLRQVTLYQNLLDRMPNNEVVRHHLATLYENLADISKDRGETEKERARRRRALDLR